MSRNDGHFIFAEVDNLTTWPTGWAFMLAWLSPIWTIGAFDSCVSPACPTFLDHQLVTNIVSLLT